MPPLTIRIQEDTKESLYDEAAEYDVSVSEYVRTLIEQGREYDDLVDRLDAKEARIADLEEQLADRPDTADEIEELREEVARLETRNEDLTNQLAAANRRIDGAAELVEYVEEEWSLAQRRDARQKRKEEASVLKRAKWWLVGMPNDDE